ncbi:TonB-dependent receptor [Comamonas endophytica]|uniref:TonB-dependent receptor n=1 Tax=Comamonas endophytica TaxID=2949090 RepID=A0ABY6G7P2_9BURK|nr:MULTISPECIES: TonB-dependent receptor [unclassified Acidovorax]MCD2511215.1 TonB-dependent receptor [Acidovorax sp. D4N7]UYG50612.1 TonB-dependent receptor [Acidovorax sp. 5MLIR]
MIPCPPRPGTRQLPPLLCATLALCLGAAARADELPAVTVKGQALEASRAAYSVPTLGREDIQAAAVSEVEALWRNVPGMHVNHYQLGGVANSVVLRGFSGGGHGGDVAATLDGISLNEAMSHADGYFDLNVVVPLELEEVAVHQGPVSVLQGNFNRAGLIELRTRRSGEYRDVALQAGSHGSLDAQAALGLRLDADSGLFLAAQHARSDGARPDSGHERSTLSARWQRQLGSGLRIALSGRMHAAEADSPGYLGFAQWQAAPQGKDARVQGDGSDKHFKTLRLDVNHDLGSDTRLLAYAYGTQQDFVRWFTRPRGGSWAQREERYERSVAGAGLNLGGDAQWAGRPAQWTLGLEALRESTDYGYWDDLRNRARSAGAISDREATLNNAAAFGQLAWQLHPLFAPSVGLRHDRFTGDCQRLGAETGTDPCTRMQRVSHTSPKLGFSSRVHEWVTLRASWSEGFALPGNFAKYALGAAQLDPNIFRQTELGLQWRASSRLWLDLALYRMRSSQEIRNLAPGVYENFGQTSRKGAELQALWTPSGAVELRWNYGRAQSRVARNANAALLGRQVAAVPRYTSMLQARWQMDADWALQGALRHVGRMAVDAANNTWSQAYHVADLGVQYRLPASTGLQNGTLSLMVRNLTDKTHASNLSVIGGELLVAPGAPRTVLLGLNFSL